MFDDYVQRSMETNSLNLFPKEPMDYAEFIEHLKKTSAQIQLLCRENQRQLTGEIEPLLHTPDDLTQEQITELTAFAEALKKAGCNELYLSQKVYETVLYCARKQGNIPQIIRQLYNCGMTYYQRMREKQLSLAYEGTKVGYENPFFFAMTEYMEHWKALITDSETMDFLIRGYANRILGLTAVKFYEQMIRIGQETLHKLDDPELPVKFPDLPYDRYRLAIHQNILTAVGAFREEDGQAWAIRQLADSTAFLDKHIPQRKMCCADVYRHHTGLYHTGQETADQLVENLLAVCRKADPNDFSREGIWGNIRFPAYVIAYISDTDFSPEEKDRITRKSEKALFSYCLRFENPKLESYFLNSICNILNELLNKCRAAPDKLLVDLIMKRHTPTYIHSVMVARLSHYLTRALYQKDPDRLRELEETCGGRERMFTFVYRAGLFHDIGKVLCITTVGIYTRKLFPEEFEIIEQHPLSSYLILKSNRKTARYAQPALMHHYWYDRSRGYPELSEDFSENPLFNVVTDIISVADSLDAATDTIGRSYSPGISLEKLAKEMRAGRNTRYAGYLVDLLDDPKVYEKLNFLTGEGRISLYRKNYRRLQKRMQMENIE